MPGLRGTPAGITTTCVCVECVLFILECVLFGDLCKRAPQSVSYESPVCVLCVPCVCLMCPLCVSYVSYVSRIPDGCVSNVFS